MNNFDKLRGQAIVIDGFVRRFRRTFIISEGQARPDGVLGARGDRYWCDRDGPSQHIWFELRQLDRRWVELLGDTEGRGRRLVVAGRLAAAAKRAEPVTEYMIGAEVDVDAETREDSYGPLQVAAVVEVKPETCEGWPEADWNQWVDR